MKKIIAGLSLLLTSGLYGAGEITVINKIIPKNGAFTGVVDSSQTVVITDTLDNNLNGVTGDVQSMLEAIDNLTLGGSGESTLQVSEGGVEVSSPTQSINFTGADFDINESPTNTSNVSLSEDISLSTISASSGLSSIAISSNVAISGVLSVNDEAYGAGWNGSLEVPTKNAVYDKVETISGVSPAGNNTEVQFNNSSVFGSSDTFTFTPATSILNLGETSALFNSNSKYRAAFDGNAYFQTIGFSDTDTLAGGVLISRSRGTASSPTTVASGDRLGAVLAQGYDGSTMQTSGGFLFEVDGSVSTGIVPTRISFETEGSDGTRYERMRLNSEGVLLIGKETTTSNDPLVVIGRTLSGSGNAHAFVDESVVNKSGTIGYNSFDAKAVITGSNNYDHIAGMQSRPNYASSGSVDRLTGYQTIIDHDGGNASRVTSYEARQYTGSGTADLQVGLYVQNLTEAASNYAISVGTSDTNQNLLHVGVTGDPLLYWDETADNFTFNKNVEVPVEVYGAGWNGSSEVATKDDIYDKIESLPGGGGASVAGSDTEIQFNDGGVFGSSATFNFTKASSILSLGESSALFNSNSKYRAAFDGNAYFQTIGFSNTDTTAGGLLISRSRGTASSASATQSGDRLGAVLAQGYDGTSMQTSAGFLFEVDGTVSSGVMPTRISFETEGASGTRFERMRLTSEGVLLIGKETTTSNDPMVVVGRTLTGSGNAHAYVDETNLNKTGTIGYNSFDAKPEVTGSQNYDHIAGMQSRPDYASSGTVDRLVGFQTIINTDGGNANRVTSFEARDYTGTGTADLQVGLYVQNLTQATSNYAISVGTSDTNQNLLHVGVTGDPLLSWDEGNDVFTLNKDMTVPTEVYGVAWNASNEVPTKDAVYDKIESLSLGGGGSSTLQVKENDVEVSSPTASIDFLGEDFDLTESPTGEANISLSEKIAISTLNASSGLDSVAISTNVNIYGDITGTLNLFITSSTKSMLGFDSSNLNPTLILRDHNSTRGGLIRFDSSISGEVIDLSVDSNNFELDISTNLNVSGNVFVTDDTYGVGWDASLEVPTKNAVYDKIESLSLEKLYSVSAPGTLATIPDGVAEYDGVAPINEDAGTNANILTAIFDDTADECRGFQIISPTDLDTSGTAEFHVNWYSGSSTSGNVQWYVAISTMSEGTSWDKVPTQYGATSDAVQGTVDQVTKTSWTASVSTLGITAEQLVTGWFCRDGDGDIGTDSMTGDAAVISFGIGLPRQ